jgi:hypothetical protein
VFDLHGTDRLTFWKNFRDRLEKSENPFDDVVILWSQAPFVNHYLNHGEPKSWPDPWRLIIDGKFDDLAICLGMLYTLTLTERFIDLDYEIHMSILPNNNEKKFFLVVDNCRVLNYEYRAVLDVEQIKNVQTTRIYQKSGSQ